MSLWESNKQRITAEISEAFDITQGNIKQSAELVGIHVDTIYDYMRKDEALENKLLECRKGIKIKYTDYVEFQLMQLINMVNEHPATAFNSIKYFLDAHGQKRGWGPKQDVTDVPPLEKDIDYKVENMRLSHKIKEMEIKLANIGQTEPIPSGSDTQIQHLGGSSEVGQDLL